MAYSIPTLSDLIAANLARFESALGQTSPQNDKAFLKVLSATEGAQGLGIYKYASDRVKAVFALTAIGEDLDIIGQNESTSRKPAEIANVTAEITAVDGTIISANSDFIADSNGLRYKPSSDVTAVGGVATLDLFCTESGSSGSLEVGDTLEISSQVANALTTATVTVIVQDGIDIESDTDYRPRVLFAQRAITGGANAIDHKIWAEAVTGVKQAFPYSGRPADEGTSYPGDRQVYIEAVTSIDADGLAPAWLLANVRSEINYDPDTGYSRAPLGLTDATLFLRTITRTTFYVEVRDFTVDTDKDAACKAAILAALTTYFSIIKPFVDGVDLPQERNDTITSMSVGNIVQDVLVSFGATSTSVGFGIVVGAFLSSYNLGLGELGKLGAVAYA